MLGFAGIGAASMRLRREHSDDYLLAGREISPFLAALSAVATNNSGYMFIGQIGLTYAIGVRSLWLAVGWIVGDALTWWRVHPRVRALSEAENVRSVPSLLGGRERSRAVIVSTALLVIVFLGTYAAAQLQAGAKAMHAILGTEAWVGIVLSAAIVLFYSYAGGLRASIWTDVAQSFVMMGSMCALLVWSVGRIGGFDALATALEEIDPALVDPWTSDAPWGLTPWAMGWLGGGLGVLGQPTILTRTMSLRRVADVPRTGAIYFAWFIPFFIATIALGLCARVLVPDLSDAELAMPTLATRLLPDLLVGLMLAGVFAATMSTADSQILSCSAAITEDLLPRRDRPYWANKLATAIVTAMVLAIALFAEDGVFVLVLYAWAALAVTLGPLVVVRAMGAPLPWKIAIAMMTAGLLTMFAWRAAGLAAATYEILPGMFAAGAVYAVYGSMSALGMLTHPKK